MKVEVRVLDRRHLVPHLFLGHPWLQVLRKASEGGLGNRRIGGYRYVDEREAWRALRADDLTEATRRMAITTTAVPTRLFIDSGPPCRY